MNLPNSLVPHQLEKLDNNNLVCQSCKQTWKGKPRSLCPGVHLLKLKVKEKEDLAKKYWQIDSLARQNLRPTTKVCCVKEGKEFIYFYDREGTVEKIDPLLPPVLSYPDYVSCDSEKECPDATNCLKSEIGLKKLNLVRGTAKPVAVYFSGQEFIPLYNSLDCQTYRSCFPPTSRRYIHFSPPADLLGDEKLQQLNFKPKMGMTAYAARWHGGYKNDWELLWDIKQCEIADPNLPLVTGYLPSGLCKAAELAKFNRTAVKTLAINAIWDNGQKGFVLLYNPQLCPILNPDLPPVLPYSPNFSSSRASQDTKLKSEIGLKKLNLDYSQVKPKAVFYLDLTISFSCRTGNFIHLFDQTQCKTRISNLPPIIDSIYKTGDLLGDLHLKMWNLKPKSKMKAVAVIWDNTKEDWQYLWDIKQCELDNLKLPQVLDSYDGCGTSSLNRSVSTRQPKKLFKESQLENINRKVESNTVATACVWNSYHSYFELLYDPTDCALIDESLPPCYDVNNIPTELRSQWSWSKVQPLYELKENAIASGCYITWNNYRKTYELVLLYTKEQLVMHQHDVLISKTKLKQNYLLSEGWISKIGEPDEYHFNPINSRYAPMKMYSRYRIEKYLADNAQAYTSHLAKRDTYLSIFEQNKDRLLSPEARAKAKRTKEIKRKIGKVTNQFNWNYKNRLVQEQSIKCLQCASGIAGEHGFFCAINPMGLEIDLLPCPEWQRRLKSQQSNG